MSKLDREIKAVFEDIEQQAKEILPKLIPIMIDESLDNEQRASKLNDLLKDISPKTYDVYIKDMKNVFKQNGWTANV